MTGDQGGGGAVGRRSPVQVHAAIMIHQVDVFTRTPFAGNAAAAVLDSEGLSDGAMQAIAREMNLSETAFVFGESHDGVVPLRFFTPTREVPVCGHATLGAHFVRARHLGLAEGAVMHASPGARWHVRWERRDGATFLTMRQAPVRYGSTWDDDELARRLLTALAIDRHALRPGAPVQIIHAELHLDRGLVETGPCSARPHPKPGVPAGGTPSKKSTTPVSSEYSAPTTSRPSNSINCSRRREPLRRWFAAARMFARTA